MTLTVYDVVLIQVTVINVHMDMEFLLVFVYHAILTIVLIVRKQTWTFAINVVLGMGWMEDLVIYVQIILQTVQSVGPLLIYVQIAFLVLGLHLTYWFAIHVMLNVKLVEEIIHYYVHNASINTIYQVGIAIRAWQTVWYVHQEQRVPTVLLGIMLMHQCLAYYAQPTAQLASLTLVPLCQVVQVA